jgi:hypothetical protein
MKRFLVYLVLAATVFAGGCAKESSLPSPTGKGTVRALNTIPDSPDFGFLIEERSISTVGAKSITSPSSWDDLEYTFNFQVLLPGGVERVASQSLDVQADTNYTFVISGAVEAPTIDIWEAPVREWDASETVFSVRLAHAAVTLGQVDIYLLDEATAPAIGLEAATLLAGEAATPADIEAGDYVLTVTPAGDDTTILFQSDAVTFSAQNEYVLTVFDPDGNDIAPVSVRLFSFASGGGAAIIDSRFPPQIRFIHGSISFGNADIYTEDPLATAQFSDHAFTDVTPFIDVAIGALPITYTAPGNQGALLVDVDVDIFAGTRTDFYVITDATGADLQFADIQDRRTVSTTARVILINTASNREAVDAYLITPVDPPPADPRDPAQIEGVLPRFPLLQPGRAPRPTQIAEGSYDLIITESAEKIILADPIRIDLALGDLVEGIIFETAQPDELQFAIIPPP